MMKAVKIDPDQWRYGLYLAQMYYNEKDYAHAARIAGDYFAKDRRNYFIADIYVKSLIALKQYKKAENIIILPFEGQAGSHVMYRDVKLHLAASCIDAGRYDEAAQKVAQSRLWPENLGVGKPYDEFVDNTLEDWLDAVILHRTGRTELAAEYMEKVSRHDADGYWQKCFDVAVRKQGKGYPAVMPMLSDMDASTDKRLF